MGSMLYLASGLENVPKSPENGCFLLKATVFHGPSGKAQTRGILVPQFFLILSGPFPCFPLRCPLLSEPLVSTVSRYSGPVYGLICGQPLLSSQMQHFSPPPARRLFPFLQALYLRWPVYAIGQRNQCLQDLVRWKQRIRTSASSYTAEEVTLILLRILVAFERKCAPCQLLTLSVKSTLFRDTYRMFLFSFYGERYPYHRCLRPVYSPMYWYKLAWECFSNLPETPS